MTVDAINKVRIDFGKTPISANELIWGNKTEKGIKEYRESAIKMWLLSILLNSSWNPFHDGDFNQWIDASREWGKEQQKEEDPEREGMSIESWAQLNRIGREELVNQQEFIVFFTNRRRYAQYINIKSAYDKKLEKVSKAILQVLLMQSYPFSRDYYLMYRKEYEQQKRY